MPAPMPCASVSMTEVLPLAWEIAYATFSITVWVIPSGIGRIAPVGRPASYSRLCSIFPSWLAVSPAPGKRRDANPGRTMTRHVPHVHDAC